LFGETGGCHVNQTRLLEGLRVLDLTKATSGPFCTQMLGDLGADIVKVEEPPEGGRGRDVLDAVNRIDDMDTWFLCVNRNKRSVGLRLSDPDGLAVFYDLVRHADVVVDNYRPGVTAKLRLDHATLTGINPQVITCSLSGYGATGPLSHRAGFDITVQAQTGMATFIGLEDDDGRTLGTRAAIADLVGGMYCATAIPAAVIRRIATGEGCHLDIAMYDAVLSWFAGFGVFELNFGEPAPIGGAVLWGTFMTKDRPLVIAAHRNSQYERFCRALERPEWLTDPRFAAPKERAANMPELRAMVDELLADRTAAEWIERFEAVGLSFAELNTIGEGLTQPQTIARQMVVDVATHDGGSIKLIGNPMKADGIDDVYTVPPLPGEHTATVLRELLGLDDVELKRLHDAGSIYVREQ
jgi:crotonobetainyl-CoA:carnitine CoA-transferase CaiB-like acyl-CoA transferase